MKTFLWFLRTLEEESIQFVEEIMFWFVDLFNMLGEIVQDGVYLRDESFNASGGAQDFLEVAA